MPSPLAVALAADPQAVAQWLAAQLVELPVRQPSGEPFTGALQAAAVGPDRSGRWRASLSSHDYPRLATPALLRAVPAEARAQVPIVLARSEVAPLRPGRCWLTLRPTPLLDSGGWEALLGRLRAAFPEAGEQLGPPAPAEVRPAAPTPEPTPPAEAPSTLAPRCIVWREELVAFLRANPKAKGTQQEFAEVRCASAETVKEQSAGHRRCCGFDWARDVRHRGLLH